MISRRAAAMLGLGLALAGCSLARPRPTLPTVQAAGCRDVGIPNATLAGDPKDPRVTWLIQDGQRRDVVFPTGYAARFAPQLEILDGSGHVIARAGDLVGGGCVTGADAQGPLLILWPPPSPT
jgi:hypothetical protein